MTGSPAGERRSVAHPHGHRTPGPVCDYWLGGKDNFAADRAAAEQVLNARLAAGLGA